MPKVLDPDSLAPKRPASDVQDYLARKYASLRFHPEPNPTRHNEHRPKSSTAKRKINNIQRNSRERTHFFA